MRVLIADDNFISRTLLKKMLASLGDCDVVVNGHEAVQAAEFAFKDRQPYDLICMDIMMPDMDGHEALEKIRGLEEAQGISQKDGAKAIMVSALDDPQNVIRAFKKGGATSYIVKPIEKEKLYAELQRLHLMN